MNEQDAKKLVKDFFVALFRNDKTYLKSIFDESRVDMEDFYRIMKENNLVPGQIDENFDDKIDLLEFEPTIASGWSAIAPFIEKNGKETDFSISFSIDSKTGRIEVDNFRIL